MVVKFQNHLNNPLHILSDGYLNSITPETANLSGLLFLSCSNFYMVETVAKKKLICI